MTIVNEELHFENRAWKGTRLHNKNRVDGVVNIESEDNPLKEDRDVWFDFCIQGVKEGKEFWVEECYTYKHNNACYGGNVLKADSVEKCFAWIEKKHRVKCICDDEIMLNPLKDGLKKELN